MATSASSCNRWFWNISRTTPAAIVIPGAMAHIHGLGHRDLDVIHIAAVPDRLEDGIGKAEEQDILRSFLAQVMIDAVDLAFVKNGMHCLVEFLRRGQISAKGFFDDDPPPAVCLARHAGLPQAIHTTGSNIPAQSPGNTGGWRAYLPAASRNSPRRENLRLLQIALKISQHCERICPRRPRRRSPG